MTKLNQTHAGEARSKSVVNSQLYSSDPNTSDPPVWRRDQRRTRQADCQTSSMSELPKQTSKHRNIFLSGPFVSPSMLWFVKLYYSLSSISLITRVVINLLQDVKQRWEDTLHITFLFYSWPYVTGPVVGMCGDGDGRSVRPHWGAVKLSTPRDHRTLEQGSVIHGRRVTSLRGRRSNSRTKILLMSLPAAMHQVVLSRVLHQKYPGYFLLNGNFSQIHFCVCK